ncbi:MAG: diacylglycerol kinase, partial [Lacisediminimonas sp.]|nr:diacylglycerol kinase [Lacisediminimonas sp.]
ASLGLYPTLLQDREDYKKQWGRHRWVAMLAAVLTILRHDSQLRIRIGLPGGSRALRTPTLFICNNPLQLEQLGLPYARQLEEGQLAAIALKPSSRMALLWLLVRGAFGRLGDADNVISFPFPQMTVETRRRRRIRVATDGEVTTLRTPLEFAVSPRPLLLLRPRQERNP